MNYKINKHLFRDTLALLGLFSMTGLNAENIPAFPGALGFGANATGGRKGKVYHVTNLNDSGTGSFRDAVSASNRIVVFDVGGNIDIKTAIQVKSNITIAGQTAPGGGIAIEGGKVSCGSQANIIIRHLRMRPGSNTANRTDDGINMYRAENCIVDHCSIEFAPWNNVGGSGSDADKSTDITFQYCLIADPIDQQFGAHIESVNSQWTWFGNCFANTHNRNPLDKVNDVFVNNVLYNYQGGYTTHTSTKFKHDIVNNYFVGGPSSGSTDNTWYQVDKNQSIYYSGNMKDRNKDGVLNGSVTTPYWYQGTGTVLSSPWSTLTNTLPTTSAATAFRMVSSIGGARPVDPIDNLVWSQVESVGKKGTMYTSQTGTGLDNGGFGTIVGGDKPTDSDGDGMPDYWENAMNLDNSKDDAMNIAVSGYANIEEYINWLGNLHEQTDENTDLAVDLTKYTSGWKAITASYKVGNAVNGSVTLNGSKATFTPTANSYGMGSFDFTVSGNDGTSYSTTIYVLILKGESVVLGPPTLTKQGAGSSSQSIAENSQLTSFSYLWSNASSVKVIWEPMSPEGITCDVNTSKKTVTFSGTALKSGTYKYSITTVSNSENEATASGTIIVGDGSFPAAELQKQGGGSSSQNLYAGADIASFNFQWFNATGVIVTWQPSTPKGITVKIDEDNNKVYFSGSISECNTYRYTVTTKGLGAEASKSGTLSVIGRSHIFSCDTTNSDWTSSKYWNTGMVPTDCDSAIIRKGEVNAVSDINALTIVEKDGTLRIRKDITVQELHMRGGTLKSYTSNPLFQLTANDLYFEDNTYLLVGSTEASEFKLIGNASGNGNIGKSGKGILTLKADFSNYDGRWSLSEGTIDVVSNNGLGTNGIDVAANAKLKVSVVNSTGSITIAEGSNLIANADLTVDYATLGSQKLGKGTYTSTDFPSIISGEGKLIVLVGESEVTGLESVATDAIVSVYPNPITSSATIDVKDNGIFNASVCDLSGRVVRQVSSSGSSTIDFSNIPNGVYFIKVEGTVWTRIFKVFVNTNAF